MALMPEDHARMRVRGQARGFGSERILSIAEGTGMTRTNRLAPHGGKSLLFARSVALLFLGAVAAFLGPGAGSAAAQDGAFLDPAADAAALFCGEATTVTWTYTPEGPSTPAMRGYSVTVVAPPGLTFGVGDVTVLSPLGGVSDTHFLTENDDGDVTIDFAFLEPGAGLSDPADLFTITMTSTLHGAPVVSTAAAMFRDLGNQSITMTLGASAPVVVDCTAPDVPTLDPEPTFTQGTANTLSWSDESASGAATYNVQCATDGGFTNVVDESGWIAGLGHQFTGLNDGGTYFYRVAARNLLDVSAGYSGFESSTQDATPPITTAAPLAGVVRTTTFDVPIIFADATSGPGTVELFYKFEVGAWISYGVFPGDGPVSFTAADGDGDYLFRTQGIDAAGNVEPANATVQATATLDTSGPYATFVVNAGAAATNDPAVTLAIDAHRVTEMRFSNDGSVWPEGWVPVAPSHAWTIAALEGVRTVFGEFRDGLGTVWATTDVILFDVTPGGPVTVPDASPGHETITVSWTNPADPDFERVEVWRGLVHDGGGDSAYPWYNNPTVPAPPVDRASAEADPDWVLAGTSQAGATFYDDDVPVRGIYHYALFALDHAGNPSGPAATVPRATSYVLGDTGHPYDGLVGVFDMTVLGAAYGATVVYPEFNGEADFGPTDDGTGTGIPEPDMAIDFEDVQIASVNFTPGAKSGPAAPGTRAGTALLAWRQTGDLAWELELIEPCPELKGIRLAADLPDGVAATVTPGPLLAGQAGPVFLRNIPRLGLDAGLSVLGRGVGIEGAGVLMSVRLPDGADPGLLDPARIRLEVRDVANGDLAYEMAGKDSGGTPPAFRLLGAHPNPFNPRTTVSFTLPAETDVRLEIYGLDGRRVALLVDGLRGPGLHETVWNGLDDRGRPAASGVYFTRLTAGSLSQVGKLTLLK